MKDKEYAVKADKQSGHINIYSRHEIKHITKCIICGNDVIISVWDNTAKVCEDCKKTIVYMKKLMKKDNKDKEKQIEEIAKVIETGCADIDECSEKCKYHNDEPYICYSKLCAEKIYNLFYPKDSVVLSREEYNDLKGLEKKFDDYLIKEIVATRKETVEKIICVIKTFSYDKEFTKIITRIIAERFGVEIKE